MPIVSNSEKIVIEFSAEAADLLAKAKSVEKGIDELSKNLDKNRTEAAKLAEKYNGVLVPGLENASKSVGSFISKNATLIAGITAVGVAVYKSFQAFQAYAGEVRDLSLITGTGAEETSRFIQVLDDYQLTAQDAEMATKALKEKGLVPTIDTLADLAAQYQAIQDPAEKMAFIQDNLGKGGVKWLNVLNQTPEALRAQAKEVQSNLILTDEQIKKSEQARLAQDAWNDSIQGAKISVGSWIGDLIVLNEQMTDYQAMTGKSATSNGILTESFKAFQGQMERGAAMTEYYKNIHADLNTELEQTPEELQAIADSGNQFMSVLSQVSSETQSYNQKNQDLLDKLKSLTDEQSKTATWTQKYKALTTEIGDTRAAIAKLADEHKKASQKIIFDLISQQAAANGFKDVSVEALAAIGEQWGVLAKGSAAETAAMLSAADAWTDSLQGPKQALTEINAKLKNLQKLAESGITITANVVYTQTGGVYGGSNGGGACFTGDTLITLGDGSTKPIKDVQPDDTLISWDTEKNQQVLAGVVEIFEHPASDGGRLLLFNGYLKVTEEHLLWNGYNWIPAGEFNTGDLLQNLDGSIMVVRSIREIEKLEPTYNLHTNHETHNYFAGGVLVHNAKSSEMWTGGNPDYNTPTLVGDMPGGVPGPYSELLWRGHVFDAETSKRLIDAGVFSNFASMAQEGDVYTSGGSGGSTSGGGTGGGIKTKPKGGRVGGGGSSGGTVAFLSPSAGAANNQAAQQNDTNAVAMAIQQQIQQGVQAQTESNMQVVAAIQELGSIMKRENPKAVGRELSAWMG